MDQTGIIQGAIISGRESDEELDEAQSGTHVMTPVPWDRRYPWPTKYFGTPRTSTDNADVFSYKNLGGQDFRRYTTCGLLSAPYEEIAIQRGTTASVVGGLLKISCTEIPMRLKARLTPLDCFNRIEEEISKQGGVSG